MPDDAGQPIRPEPAFDRIASVGAKAADPEGGLRRAREWAEANKASIDSINAYIRENGVWGEEWRAW